MKSAKRPSRTAARPLYVVSTRKHLLDLNRCAAVQPVTRAGHDFDCQAPDDASGQKPERSQAPCNQPGNRVGEIRKILGITKTEMRNVLRAFKKAAGDI